MQRLSLSRPGGAPYLTVYAREAGHYGPDEIAPLGGRVEVLRGDYPGTGTLRLSVPPPVRPGDWVRVWLPGDADDDPTYLGEVTNEAWGSGAGELNLRPLTATVGRAKWFGAFEKRFREFLQTALSLCELPPGVTVGPIPDHLATLRASTAFELLSDTLQAAMPVIDGGTWGVDAQARVGVHAPDPTVTHRFVWGQADTPPGTADAYANSVRFPYTLPDDSQGWFEGHVPAEVAERGEVWEVTQAPASVTTPSTNPLLGLSAETVTHVRLGNVAVDLPPVLKPVFQPDWEGKLAGTAPPLEVGLEFRPATPEQSEVRIDDVGQTFFFTLNGAPRSGAMKHVLVLRDDYEVVNGDGHRGQVEVSWTVRYADGRTEAHGWQRLTPAQPDAFNPEVMRSDYSGGAAYALPGVTDISDNPRIDYRLRLTPGSFIRPGLPRGIELTNAAVVQSGGWVKPWSITGAGGRVTVPARVGPVLTALTRNWTFYSSSDPAHPLAGAIQEMGPVLRGEHPPYVAGVSVRLPAPLSVYGGSAFEVAGAGTVTAKFNGTVPLKPLDPPEEGGAVRFAYSGAELVTLTSLRLDGAVAGLGRVTAEVADVSALTAYAAGLLRYKTQPVRVWTGQYRVLSRVPASGVALFETPGGDVALDVQRVTYDLTAGTVTVEAGTPLPREDEAIGAVIENAYREIRRASG